VKSCMRMIFPEENAARKPVCCNSGMNHTATTHPAQEVDVLRRRRR
jgi:hypothetical protein